MNSQELDEYVESAKALARDRIAESQKKFGIGGFRKFNLDLEAGTIFFKEEGDVLKLMANATPVGSLAKTAKSWLWSWENDSIPKSVLLKMEDVKSFGLTNNIAVLQQTFSPCDEALAWALASISLKITDAQCVYRIDNGNNLLFLLLNNIELTH